MRGLMSTAERSRAAAAGQLLFELPGGGRALFTTRADGNLSTGSGAQLEQGMRRREELCARLGLSWLCSSRQVHGTHVHVLEQLGGAGGQPLALDADGHATALRGVGAMAMAADCLPVALGCDGAVASIHAGWRGLSAGVLERGVRTLRELGREGAPIGAIVGPGAGACCYEVGAEVHAAFDSDRALASSADGGAEGSRERPRGCLDLRAIAHERLLAAGVAEVRHVDLCTICDTRFFSHRREGTRAGRQAGIAWLS
jgi:purine-nucleoside/S-methyl-5'-thioadenosine phosphorylase / adenosine deaminase